MNLVVAIGGIHKRSAARTVGGVHIGPVGDEDIHHSHIASICCEMEGGHPLYLEKVRERKRGRERGRGASSLVAFTSMPFRKRLSFSKQMSFSITALKIHSLSDQFILWFAL
jgi:hypothetical protein